MASLTLARSPTFVEIDHEIISTAILLPSADSRRVVVGYKREYVHKVLVIRFVQLAQEKSVVRCTDRPDLTIAVDWDICHQTKQTITVCSEILDISCPKVSYYVVGVQ